MSVFQFLFEIPAFTYWVVYAALAVFTWLRGGKWERLGTWAVILDAVLSLLLLDRQRPTPQYGFVVADTLGFLMLAAIALRSRLWWATWAAGFLLFGISMHLAMIVDEEVAYYAYHLSIGLYTYLIIGAIVVGTLTRRSPARSWRAPKP